MSAHETPLPGIWTLVRDVLMFCGGWVVIFLEVTRPEVRESVLMLAGSVIAVPGAVAAVTGRRAGTGGSPSPSPEPAPSPSSPP